MNCDEIFAALELGDELTQQTAQAHLEGCPRCCEAVRAFDDLKRELARGDLPSTARNVWLSAASGSTRRRVAEPVPARLRPTPARRLIAAVAAAVVLAAVAALLIPEGRGPETVVDAPVQKLSDPELVAKLSSIQSDLSGMRDEIARLRSKAELLDVRSDTRRLLAAYVD